MVVVLRGGVVVVVMVVVVVTLDVSVGKQEGGRGRRLLLGGCSACRQRAFALDGAVPTRRTRLGGGGDETERRRRRRGEEIVMSRRPKLTDWTCACVNLPGSISPSGNTSGKVVVAVVSSRVVEEIRPGTEAVTVDHPAWSLTHTEV